MASISATLREIRRKFVKRMTKGNIRHGERRRRRGGKVGWASFKETRAADADKDRCVAVNTWPAKVKKMKKVKK